MTGRVPYRHLLELATALFILAGLARDRAEVVARILLEGDLLGHTTHGLALLPAYMDEMQAGRMTLSGEPEVIAESPGSLVLDGRRLPGPWLVDTATRLAAARAGQQGVFTIVIRRSHHIACLAAYLQAMTSQGMMVVVASSDPAAASVAPFGGTRRLITPNPVAAGIPTAGDPILIDISMSTTTNGMVTRSHAEGHPLPGEWLFDAQGHPTADPEEFFADPPGSILPLGGIDLGYKGFALGLIVEMLTGALGGHGRADPPEGWGATVFVQVIDPRHFSGTAAFERQVEHLKAGIWENPSIPGFPPPRLPGQGGLERRRRQFRDGLELHPAVRDGLRARAQLHALDHGL